MFSQKKGAPVADNALANIHLEIIEETKYLGITLQSNLKFDKHIQSKIVWCTWERKTTSIHYSLQTTCGERFDCVGPIYQLQHEQIWYKTVSFDLLTNSKVNSSRMLAL